MDFPDEHRLKETIERLTRENEKLRTQLAVAQQWYPPLDLERAFRSARGWQCLTVSLMPEKPTLILISGGKAGKEEEPDAAGEVWRHLQTAVLPRGRIGPFARARMPSRLLGYLREQSGRTIIVINRDLRRGQVSRAARMLREGAKRRRPATRLMELSAIPLLSICTLLYSHTAATAAAAGFSGAVPPSAVEVRAESAYAMSPNFELLPLTRRDESPANSGPLDRHPPWPGVPLPSHDLDSTY
jgi:hypothetical protein